MANKIKKMMNNGTAYTVGGIESSNDTYENIIHLSQAEYDALETKDPDTLYSTPDNAESGAFEPENEGTEGQVLTKTATGYAWCDAGTSTKYGFIDFLVVGGGGGGGPHYSGYFRGGGGGAGGYIENQCFAIGRESYCIVVGQGGTAGNNGGNSCMGGEIAFGGGRGGGSRDGNFVYPSSGGSGGGAMSNCNWNDVQSGCSGCEGQGNGGGKGCKCVGGGGGGAGGAGCDYNTGGCGGIGKCSCISGECVWYAGGGSGYGCSGIAQGKDGCGGGGNNNLSGNSGVVIIRYKTDGSDKILPISTGGCKYTCGDYTIHCFTNDGTFIPFYK